MVRIKQASSGPALHTEPHMIR